MAAGMSSSSPRVLWLRGMSQRALVVLTKTYHAEIEGLTLALNLPSPNARKRKKREERLSVAQGQLLEVEAVLKEKDSLQNRQLRLPPEEVTWDEV